MESRFYTEYGQTMISNKVIAEIVAEAAMSTYGIIGFSHRNLGDGILTLLHKDNMFKGVKIESTPDGIIINLDVILEYGVSIAVVGQNIIETVKYMVESTTGLKVSRINVYVQGIGRA